MHYLRFTLVGLLVCATMASAASIYRYRGPDGETLFSDRPIDDPRYTLLSHSRNGKYLGQLSAPAMRVSRQQIETYIDSAAKRYSVDAKLIKAIIQAESGFNPYAMSKAGAVGLMQLMPDTAAGYNIADLMDPQANIDAGVRHVADLLRQFNNDIELVLAAYNAGAGAVKRYGGVPPFSETRRYIDKVLTDYRAN